LPASPDAAKSPWVKSEVEEWLHLNNESLDKFLIILTDGEISWNDSGNDFDWQVTTALPPNLRG